MTIFQTMVVLGLVVAAVPTSVWLLICRAFGFSKKQALNGSLVVIIGIEAMFIYAGLVLRP